MAALGRMTPCGPKQPYASTYPAEPPSEFGVDELVLSPGANSAVYRLFLINHVAPPTAKAYAEPVVNFIHSEYSVGFAVQLPWHKKQIIFLKFGCAHPHNHNALISVATHCTNMDPLAAFRAFPFACNIVKRTLLLTIRAPVLLHRQAIDSAHRTHKSPISASSPATLRS